MPRTKMAARKAGAATRAAAKTTTNVSVEVETEAGVDDTEMSEVTDEVEQVDAAKDEEGKTVEVNGDAETKETEDGTTGAGGKDADKTLEDAQKGSEGETQNDQVNNDVSEANEKTEESTKDANKEDASVKMETGDVKVESDGDASKLDTEKENEIVTPQTEADIGTVKSETEGDAMETDGEKLPEGEKSETVSDGGTEKTEVEADGKSKEEETGTSDGTGTTETVDKEGAEKTEMDTSEKKGEEESAAKLEDEIQKIDIPFPESFMKLKQLTVNIGPIFLEDLQSKELLSILRINHKFEIKFDNDEEEDDDKTIRRPTSGIVRIPFKVKTPTFFITIYNKLSSLNIGGRDMSVKFPEQFSAALVDAKKWREQRDHALRDIRMNQFEEKRRRIRVKNLPNTVTTDTIKSLFPEATSVQMYKTGVADTVGAYITFKTRGEAKKCVEDTKDMTVEDRKVRMELFVHEDGISEANFFANKRGRKRKGGPSSSGGPAKREDLKKDTPKKEDDKKESTKNDSNKKDEAKKDVSKDGAKKEDAKKDAKPKSTEKGKEEERRSSSSYESRSRARRNRAAARRSAVQLRSPVSRSSGPSPRSLDRNRPGSSSRLPERRSLLDMGRSRTGNQFGLQQFPTSLIGPGSLMANMSNMIQQGMMGNQFGMNLANQAMNMGMNQGNMGMMGNMQRMSPGGQGGGQFNDGGMRSGLGGGEEGARKRRNRKKNKGGAMGLSAEEEEDPKAMLALLKSTLSRMEDKIAKQSSSQSYDKDDSVGNIKQSRMEVDKPAYDSGRAGSRFSDDRYRNTARSGYEKMTSNTGFGGGASSTGNTAASRFGSGGKGSYGYGSQGSASQSFGSPSTPNYQIQSVMGYGGDQSDRSYGIGQSSNVGYGGGQSNQGYGSGQSNQGFGGSQSGWGSGTQSGLGYGNQSSQSQGYGYQRSRFDR